MIGSTLWFYVLNSEPIQIEKDFEISYLLPKDVAFSSSAQKSVSVSLKGARAFLESLEKRNPKFFFDLRGKKIQLGKEEKFNLDPRDFPIPFNIKVMKFSPKTLSLKFDRKAYKKLKLKPMFVGELPNNLQFDEFSVEPEFLEVSGPWHKIKKLGGIESSPIDLSKLKNDGVLPLSISGLDPRIEIPKNSLLNLRYTLKSREANKTFVSIPVRFLSPDQGFSPITRRVSVDVFIPENLKDEIKDKDIRAIAELPSDLASGVHELELRIELPKGVHLQKLYPSRVKIRKN